MDLQDLTDLHVTVIVQIKQRDWRLERVIQLSQGLEHGGCIDFVDRRRRYLRKLIFGLTEVQVGMPAELTAMLQVLPMKGGKKPTFHLGRILELMTFPGPDIEGLLSQIASIG